MDILFEDVLSDGSAKTVRGIADTLDGAIAKARSLIPSNAISVRETQVSAPRSQCFRVEALDEKTARTRATELLGKAAARISAVRLRCEGRHGFLGIGRDLINTKSTCFTKQWWK